MYSFIFAFKIEMKFISMYSFIIAIFIYKVKNKKLLFIPFLLEVKIAIFILEEE